MDPAQFTRQDTVPPPPQLDGLSETPTSKSLQTPISARANGKTAAVGGGVPRIDTEPIYTALKAALGDDFGAYRDVIADFVLGKLNQAELTHAMSSFLSPALSVSTHPSSPDAKDARLTSTVQLHNQLLLAIFANVFRDPPPDAIAPWVLAPDDAAALNQHAAKGNAVGGAANEAEERLKRDVMSLSARDRRRIKNLKDANPEAHSVPSGPLADNLNYNQALTVPVTNGDTEASIVEGKASLAKTNWDLEIKRMYAMSLAAETLEFPTRPDVLGRIEPICYQEGVGLTATTPLSNAALQSCAELIETACEMYVKEALERWISLTRTNGEGMPLTAAFKAQRHKEEEAVERGELARTPAGLLPCEAEVGAHREPLSADELRLSLRLDHDRLPNDPFLAQRILGDIDVDMDAYNVATPEDDDHHLDTILTNGHANGIKDAAGDPMVVDSDDPADYGWNGGAPEDREDLMAALSGIGY